MMALTLVVIHIPGIVLAHLIIPKNDKDKYFWIIAPFLGISITILVLQSLVYLDIPLRISVFPYFLVAVICAGYIFFKHRNDIPKIPRTLYLFSLAVLLIHGIGFLGMGANNYIGHGWTDQYTYVTVAQFLMDKPFSTGYEDVGNEPYLVGAIVWKIDRIGLPVLNGLVAVLGNVNAKTAYGSVSLLSPFLTFLVVWLISCRVIRGKWEQYGAALSASLIQGFAMIHLGNFFSHSVAVPFLLLWPLVIENAIQTDEKKNIIMGIILLSGVYAIYAEFLPILIILALSALFWNILQKGKVIQSSIAIFLILAGGFLVNFGYIVNSISVMARGITMNPGWNTIYPYASKVEGLGYLWFGYSGPLLGSKWIIFAVNFVSILLTLLAFVGLINIFRKQKNILSLSILILAIFPVIIISQPEPFYYQFFKMLRTVVPLLVIGLWSILTDFWTDEPKGVSVNTTHIDALHKTVRLFPSFVLISLLLSSVVLTGYLAALSIPSIGKNRSGVMLVSTEELLDTYSYLEGERNKDFIISVSHPLQLGWIAYHGRNNRLYFFNNRFGGHNLDELTTVKFSFNDPSKFPSSAKKIIIGEEYPKITPASLSENLMAVVQNRERPPGYNALSDFNLMGKELELLIYSKSELEKNITLNFDADPDLHDTVNQHIIELNVEKGRFQEPIRIELENKKNVSVPLSISPGLSVIKLRRILPENCTLNNPDVSSEFLVNISQMEIIGER